MNKTYLSLLALASLTALTACGGGSDGNGTNSTIPTQATGEGLYANGSNVVLVTADDHVFAIASGTSGLVLGSIVVDAGKTTFTGTGTSIYSGSTVALKGQFVEGSSLTLDIGQDTGLSLKYDTDYDKALAVPTGFYTGVSIVYQTETVTLNVDGSGNVSGAVNGGCVINGAVKTTGKAYETVSYKYSTGCGDLATTSATGAVIALGNGYALITANDVIALSKSAQ